MEEPKLTFLISTHNRRDALAGCLNSIESQSYANREIVVVVDGSDDGTSEMLAEQFPAVRTLRNPERRGIGVSLCRATDVATGDIWVNIDDDAYFPEDTAAAEMARVFAENPDFDALCFRCEAPDGTVRHREIPIRGKRMPVSGAQLAYFLGGAVAFRADALRAVGGYPTDITYGSWENSVAFRLFKADHAIRWTPSVRVIHLAIPSVFNTEHREANYIHTEVNLANRFLPFPYAQVHAVLWIALYSALATVRGRPGRALLASWNGLLEWPRLRSNRSERLSFAQTHRLSALGGRTWY